MITKIKSFFRSAKISFFALCGIFTLLASLPQKLAADIDRNGNVNTNLMYRSARWNADRYRTLIEDIRRRAAPGYIAMDIRQETVNGGAHGQYFAVNIGIDTDSNRWEVLSLVIRARDLYLVGFYAPRRSVIPGTADSLDDGTYFRIGHDSPAVPMGYPAAFTQNQIRRITINTTRFPQANYGYIENQAGIIRQQIYTDIEAFRAHTIGLINPSRERRFAFQDVLFFAQVLAEAARFRYTADNIANELASDRGYHIGNRDIELQQNWSAISTNLRHRLNDPHTPALNLQQGWHFNSLRAINSVLAICLMSVLVAR